MTMTHDINGRAYAKLSDLKAKVQQPFVPFVVELDAGFTCHKAGKVNINWDTASGELYFECDEGRHYIDGQADDGEHLVGIYSI